MVAQHELIERGIPDLITTDFLPSLVAAELDFLAGRFSAWTERGGPMVRARALVCLGEESAAAGLLSAADGQVLNGHELTAAAFVVSRIGPTSAARALLERLGNEPPFLSSGDVPLGPRTLAEGPLMAAEGDLPRAATLLERAITDGDARAPLWGALARVELARVKMSARASGDAETSLTETIDQLLSAAGLFFRAGGYRSMQCRIDGLSMATEPSTLGAPNVGRMRLGRPWRVGFGVMGDVSMRASKGLMALRHLVQHPGQAIPAFELDRVANGGVPAVVPTFTQRVGAGLDDETREALLDDAVRSRVGKLLARTVSRIGEEHTLLGAHLTASLKLGRVCRYDPSAMGSVRWRV